VVRMVAATVNHPSVTVAGGAAQPKAISATGGPKVITDRRNLIAGIHGALRDHMVPAKALLVRNHPMVRVKAATERNPVLAVRTTTSNRVLAAAAVCMAMVARVRAPLAAQAWASRQPKAVTADRTVKAVTAEHMDKARTAARTAPAAWDHPAMAHRGKAAFRDKVPLGASQAQVSTDHPANVVMEARMVKAA